MKSAFRNLQGRTTVEPALFKELMRLTPSICNNSFKRSSRRESRERLKLQSS